MTCSGSFDLRSLRAVSFGLIAIALAPGCGGSSDGSGKSDSGTDAGQLVQKPAALKIDPTSGTFGSVVVGKASMTAVELTVSNAAGNATSGPIKVEVSPAGEFAATGCSATTLAGGASCKISVSFTPSAAGLRTATVAVSATPGGAVSASLSGTGQSESAPRILPDNANFGDVAVGSMTGTVRMFTVTNPGTAPATITLSINGADFMLTAGACGMAVPGGGSCTATVTFRPASGGAKAGTLIATSSGGVGQAALAGNGLAAARLVANPAMAAIAGTVGVVSAPVTIGIANTGDERTGTISATLGGANAADFMIASNTCVVPLAGLGNCAIGVTMRAAAAGARAATLTVSGMPGGMATVMIAGTAVTGGALTLTPATGNFMSVTVGARSAAQAFTVTNTGGTATAGAVTVTSSSGDFAIVSNTCGAALAPMGTCAVSVVFAPTTAGAATGSLTASGAGSAVAALMGTGVSGAGLSITPKSNGFGSVALNQKSTSVDFTVTNTGGAATGALTTALGGSAASQFEIAGNNCNASLAAAATCIVTVRFAPTTNMPADKAATLTVSATPGGSVTADLQGAALLNPLLTWAPTANNFGGVVVGQASTDATFILTNGGMVDTGMVAITLAGVNAGDYEIGSNGCTTLAPGVSCGVVVRFKPTALLVRNASLLAMAVGGTGSSTLSGTGLAPLEWTPLMADLGMASVGGVAASQKTQAFTLTVRAPLSNLAASIPVGFADFTVSALAGCGGSAAVVAATPATWLSVANANACTATVTFAPQAPTGARTGTLTALATGGTKADAPLTGTAVGALEITPSPADYLNVAVGTPTAKLLTVKNNSSTATITALAAALGGANAAEFEIVANNCLSVGTLQPNNPAGNNPLSSCTVTVNARATSVGAKMATLTASGLAGTSPESVVANLLANAGVGAAPTISPSPGAFGDVPLTAIGTVTFTITNPAAATANLAIMTPTTSAGEFTVGTNGCVGGLNPLPAGQSCTLQVNLTPTLLNGLGARTDTLNVPTGNGLLTVPLTGNGVQPLVIAPLTSDFGSSVLNDTTTAPNRTFTVTNRGAANINVTTSVTAGLAPNADACPGGGCDYKVIMPCASPLAPGIPCTISINFVPDAIGPTTALLKVVDSTTNAVAQATLSGTGVADADLIIQNVPAPMTRNFGDVRLDVGGSASQTFRVKNQGGAASGVMTFLSAITSKFPSTAGCDAFEVVPAGTTCANGGSPLAPAGTCDIVVRFNPVTPCAVAAVNTATFSVSAPKKVLGTTTTFAVTLSAGVIVQQGVYIEVAATPSTPQPANMGETFVGVAGPTVTLRVVNNSLAAVTLNATPVVLPANTYSAPVPGGTSPCVFIGGTPIAPAGGSCTFTMSLFPTAGTPGLVGGTVVLGTTGGNVTGGLFGRIMNDAILQITRPGANGDFSEVQLNTGSLATQTWTLTNVGERSSGALAILKAGANPNEFTVVNASSDCIGKILTVAGTCNIVVQATPTNAGLIGGVALATLTASGTQVVGSPVLVSNLRTVPVNASDLSLDDGAAAFVSGSYFFSAGGTAITTQALSVESSRLVRVLNATNGLRTGPLSITLTGANPTEFTFTGCGNATVDGLTGTGGTQTCNLTLKYTPRTIGSHSAVLTVQSTPGGSETLIIQGGSTPSVLVGPATQAFTNNQEFDFTVTIAAGATAPTGPLQITITGTDAASFPFVSTLNCKDTSLDNDVLTLAPNLATCTVRVKYLGPTAAARTATLTVSGSVAGNTATAALTGN